MRSRYLLARYMLDRVVASVLLVAFSPLMLMIALVLWSSTGRPIFFRQDRVGRHGETFSIIKFRTMVVDADRISGGYTPVEALITPFGRLLRKSSLDELPQLINIIRGEMALIGPRPTLVSQYQRYTPFQRRRVDVLPGITGLAQVTYRNDAPWSRRIVLDVEYIERVNPLLDLVILIRTMKRVGTGSDISPGSTHEPLDDLG